MTTDTREKILELALKNGRVRPVEVVRTLGISQTAAQRQLKKLVESGKLARKGTIPKVYYEMFSDGWINKDAEIRNEDRLFIDKNYLYVSADGRVVPGWEGFYEWVKKVGESERVKQLAGEYIQERISANNFINKNGWIEAMEKMRKTFEKTFVEGIYYSDFYSLPKFGKTRLGQMVLYAKQSQNVSMMDQVAKDVADTINRLIALNKIDAVGFIPHSVPRKIQFLDELEKKLNLNLPKIDLQKSYGGIIVPQKTLSSLKEREENARKTILIWNLEKKFKNVLLIDDALGSGATMNETAKKLKETGVANKVFGYAIVGSMKGFDVIREVSWGVCLKKEWR